MMKSSRDLKSPRGKKTMSGPLTRMKKSTSASTNAPSAVPSGNVKVVVRIRPHNHKEIEGNPKHIVKIIDQHLLIFDPKEDDKPFFYHGIQQKSRDFLKKSNKQIQFMFDHVFDQKATNQEIFENSTRKLIKSLMDGYNCSVFAYGATGAGKTFTMLGSDNNPGITFLTMTELFQKKEDLSDEREFELGITYLEVYNELVQDLLNPGNPLMLREDNKFGVIVSGIRFATIRSAKELYSLLDLGNKCRTQHPTDSNAESSRSHAVFQVYLNMKFKATGEVRTAKLSMIDLAGSERGSATGCHGARFTEGANINKSLLALGNCINSLADGHKHVPYRDSKLTRLLKDSLGGNCQTVMVANVAPSVSSYEDTYNTLRYATRAKYIKTSIKRNVVNVDMGVAQYVKIVDELNLQITGLKAQLKVKHELEPSILEMVDAMYQERTSLTERIFQLEMSEQLVALRSQIKEDANSRLSGLATGTEERIEGHRKMGDVIERCQKQSETLREELSSLNLIKIAHEAKVQKLLQQYPDLLSVIHLKDLELSHIENRNKILLVERKEKIYGEEMNRRGDLIDRLASVLKPCFLQLRGLDLATATLIDDYNSLLPVLKGVKNVKWDDGIEDSGAYSATTLSSVTENEVTPQAVQEVVHEKHSIANSTFVLTPQNKGHRQPQHFSAEKMSYEVNNRPHFISKTKKNIGSPKMKENASRRPITTGLRKTLKKDDRSRSKSRPQSTQVAAVTTSTRPIFRW